MWRYQSSRGLDFATQTNRGQHYADKLNLLANVAVTATGVKPVIGIKWWSWVDNWGEKTNWGLVSFRDNAYDGMEATDSKCVDPFGYVCGQEERSYGDFLTRARQANLMVLDTLSGAGSSGLRKNLGGLLHAQSKRTPLLERTPP